MKLDYPKEWFEARIENEGDEEIGAGFLPIPRSAPMPPRVGTEVLDARIAFGQFVVLWRRNKGWNAARLATEAGIGPGDVLEIESYCEPKPDSVCKLAEIFGVPAEPLLELVGLAVTETPHLREEAVLFAARAEPTATLSEEERQALGSFVTLLTGAKR